MKTIFAILLGMLAYGIHAGGLPRINETGGQAENIAAFEIVVPEKIPLLKFAAGELQTYLEKVTGSKIPVVAEQTGKAFAVVLGDNAAAKGAGLNVEELADEGYFIVRKGNAIYILGRDDPAKSPEQNPWSHCYRRGTLSGVYDFLERFAGVRFFFPGEIGTVAVRKGVVTLPQKIHIVERPDYIARKYISPNGIWYEENDLYNGVRGYGMNYVRLRMEEQSISFAHGLGHRSYDKRFGETHPEYFALLPDGRRFIRETDSATRHAPQLCLTSGITEEIYLDAKSYFKGESADVRQAYCSYGKWWLHGNGLPRKYYSVMPHDWLYWCGCGKCRKIAEPGRDQTQSRQQAVSDFIWQFTADIANRLAEEGIKGTVTQMAYSPYDRIPKCAIPGNVAVQLAVMGPGRHDQAYHDGQIRRWSEKLGGRKLNVWVYPGKHMGKAAFVGIPAMLARSTAEYFTKRGSRLNGVYYESETDYFIFNYLNYYVLSKVTWNSETDVDALLKDHYRTMFGSAAEPMQEFFETLETLWTERVLGKIRETSYGPSPELPNIRDFWTKIYTPEQLEQFKRLFQRAERLAVKEPDARKRIVFMREKMLGPILAEAEKYRKIQQSFGSWECSIPGRVYLRPYKGEIAEVKTVVTLSEDSSRYVFRYECEEPEMSSIIADAKTPDAPKLYADSCVDLFLNPSGDRRNYFHFAANANGVLYDAKCTLTPSGIQTDVNWNSGAQVQVTRSEKAWIAEFRVPKKMLGKIGEDGFPVNFARHRALANKKSEIYYQWSPAPGRSFHAVEDFGVMRRAGTQRRNLIPDGGFDVAKQSSRFGSWSLWTSNKSGNDKAELDDRIFITDGKSIHFTNVTGGKMNVVNWIGGIKPNTKYRFSCFIRTRGLRLSGDSNLGAGVYISDNAGKFTVRGFGRYIGTNPWFRECVDFTTPPETGGRVAVGLWIWDAAGEAWFDDVGLEEQP